MSCPWPREGKDNDRLFNEAQHLGLPLIPGGRLTQYTVPERVDLIIAAHSHDFVGRVSAA